MIQALSASNSLVECSEQHLKAPRTDGNSMTDWFLRTSVSTGIQDSIPTSRPAA